MMKILIYAFEDNIKPIGGPSGYVWNIKQERDRRGDHEISFLTTKNYKKSSLPYLAVRNLYLSFLKKKNLNENAALIKRVRMDGRYNKSLDFSQYDVVHFQSTFDLYSQRKALEGYDGVVILTSHSPKVLFKEIIQDSTPPEVYNLNRELFESAEEFDEYAFNRADYVVFPCKEAEEPYFHSWPKYPEIRDQSKIRYLPTGIMPVSCKTSRDQIRRRYHIPEDALLLSFVGRHNKVKGYDILQEIFQQFIDIYVICCGSGGLISPVSSKRWIEAGWTNDPYSIVGASDIYMLPNRETYFDIALLQTLSIGKYSLISNTGGNKYFKNVAGVKLFESVTDASNEIERYRMTPKDEINNIEAKQRKDFNKCFHISRFYDEYKNMLHSFADKSQKNPK